MGGGEGDTAGKIKASLAFSIFANIGNCNRTLEITFYQLLQSIKYLAEELIDP